MVSQIETRQHAVDMAVKTGDMPNLDLIWAKQKAEGSVACFGREPACSKLGCRWWLQCHALTAFPENKNSLSGLTPAIKTELQ